MMPQKDYQFNYTDNAVAKEKLYNEKERKQKAEMIHAVLLDHFGHTNNLRVLDMSCSTGITTKALSKYFQEVVGIDIDDSALAYARSINYANNIRYLNINALETSFEDGSFDIVICNQMYEHVPNPFKLFDEIRRVLTNNGVCYFGATSRLKIIETHYGRIPFLSYLPRPLANLYLRVLGKGNKYYETLFSYWGLKKLVSNFVIHDYTLKAIENPRKYRVNELNNVSNLQMKLIRQIAKRAYKFLPGYIWLLSKT